MLHSMTGFATLKGEQGAYGWTWDMRGVNAKGLDLRLRVPDWIDGLEPAVRGALGKAMARGSVSLGLRVQREEAQTTQVVNPAQLNSILAALQDVENTAAKRGVTLAPTSGAELLATRGVLETASDDGDSAALKQALVAQLPDLITAFLEMRQTEGAALEIVLRSQLDRIEGLTADAAAAAEARRAETAAALQVNLARVLDNTDGADPDRVAQELALIAVKTDVTEELDRLHAHVKAARELIAKGSPAGRKLDFLMQEFNREANTLCSKAQSVALTRIGLDLKAVIDQMREQVQNVE
ncbi:YicC/YloC family endoribonuclease [Thiosulfatihalobacter marinus]|uniref:YicC/YloC family endoribonuclease n=1 Tax=Thiosulfatihalobacter marinus TaxID=2792481 RepID=UPI001E491432|nr:YicC/YloC family endoribonuclease [Thiosulfatihalobacter marinus]